MTSRFGMTRRPEIVSTGLVGGAVFSHGYGVMRQNIGDGESAEGGYTDGGAHVVYEDAESGGAYAEQAVVGNAVADGGHGVFGRMPNQKLRPSGVSAEKSPAPER